MKTKTWITMSGFFMIPIFLTCLVFATISAEYWLGTALNTTSIIAPFISGKLIGKVLGVLMLVNVFGVSVIMATFLEVSKKADKIDKLDEASQTFYKATQKYEAATLRLVQMQPLEEALDLDRKMNAENIKEFVNTGKLAEEITKYVNEKLKK